jgi:hypothetical protein
MEKKKRVPRIRQTNAPEESAAEQVIAVWPNGNADSVGERVQLMNDSATLS